MAAQKTKPLPGTGAIPANQWAATTGDERPEPDESQPLLLNNGGAVEDVESLRPTSSRTSQPILEAPDEATWTPPSGFMWMEIAIMTNVFLYGFDGTITASTYAVISSEFGAANKASWLTTSYLITSAAFQPLYGRVSDIFGRRVCFFISSVAFAVGCLGCGLAPDIATLIGMRALAGIGGAGLMTMGKPFRYPCTSCCLLTILFFSPLSSDNHQLGPDSLSQAWNVPGDAKRHRRIWGHLWCCFRWQHCRLNRLAVVFHRAGPLCHGRSRLWRQGPHQSARHRLFVE